MPYVGGVGPYRERCNAVADGGYAGFAIGGRTGADARSRTQADA
jgi:cyclohexanone monooxygenase